MIRSELVTRIAEQNPHLYAKDIEAVVDAILDRIATALADGDRVELRDFGAFSLRRHELRTGRNPRTGASVVVPERTSVHFKPGKAMRERLKLKPANREHMTDGMVRAS
ncbi:MULTISPECIES: integration host factor subunit beta [unclassified Methylobacterium]|uniref:integration host factor subunit beta n=1 Tax=unclassified Methylobacterium TaxID=2615210 RepID=UPI0011C1E14A|nr:MULTISPECIES: integration host factor subunit beta [unclassified Methylobacterium]QEE41304.1 integration host factor subunit beta [Methylobacterium sp. WL1]TXN57734.1 integration host factor subunit beta [Methylobacterium sp. WL2]